MSSRRLLQVILLLGVLGPAPASAVVVYDTFALGTSGASVLLGQINAFDLQYAYPFVVSGGNYPLESITLGLYRDNDVGTNDGGDYALLLRADDGGLPGDVLEEWTLVNDLPMLMVSERTFVSLDTPTLLNGQTYWVNLRTEPGTGSGSWFGSNGSSPDLVFAQTGALDPTWLQPQPSFDILPLMTVEGPEPSQVLLAAVGALVLSSLARRRRA